MKTLRGDCHAEISFQGSETWFTYLPDISDPTMNTFKLYMYSFYTGLTSFFAIDSTILNDEKNQLTFFLDVCHSYYPNHVVTQFL